MGSQPFAHTFGTKFGNMIGNSRDCIFTHRPTVKKIADIACSNRMIITPLPGRLNAHAGPASLGLDRANRWQVLIDFAGV
jgi:hypothetical protein